MRLTYIVLVRIFFLIIRPPPRSTRTDTLFPTRRSSDLRQSARRLMSAGRVHETCNLVMKSLKKKGSEMTVIGHNHIRKDETFDGYDIIAHPLPARDERDYYPTEQASCSASVTYAPQESMDENKTGLSKTGAPTISLPH